MPLRPTLAAFFTLLAVAAFAGAPGKRKTVELQRWPTEATVDKVPEEHVAIRDAAWTAKDVPARTMSAPVAVATTGWAIGWAKTFGREATTSVSIGAWDGPNGGRFLLTGGESPTLRDLDGKLVHDPMPRLQARGRVFVDPAKERVFVSNDGVSLLDRGEDTFFLPAPGFVTSLFVSGDRLLAWGSRESQHPHGGPIDRQAVVAVMDLAKPMAHVPKIQVSGVSRVAVGATPESIAFALPDEIHLLPWDFAKGRVLTAAERFTPLSVTVDESGRVHLVAALEKRVELWIVEPDGRRRVRTALPLERIANTPDTWATADVFRAEPPMVTSDGRVFVHAGRRDPASSGYAGVLVAVSPAGDVLWQKALEGDGGAVATADGRVLATSGNTLSSFDASGSETLLFDAGEPIITPPAVVRRDAIAVATRTRLLLLRAR